MITNIVTLGMEFSTTLFDIRGICKKITSHKGQIEVTIMHPTWNVDVYENSLPHKYKQQEVLRGIFLLNEQSGLQNLALACTMHTFFL